MLAGAEHPGQRPVDQAQVPGVGDHDQRPPPGRGRRAGGAGYLFRPVPAGQRRPDRARCTAIGEGSKEGRTRRVARPGSGGWTRRGRCPWRAAIRPALGLHPRVPRRDGQPEHVSEGTRITVGDLPGERRDFGCEHGLRRNYPLQCGQTARMIALGQPFQQVAAGELAGEPDPDPAAGNRRLCQPFRHEVVKWPVQMGQRHIDRDPRDRQLGRHRGTGSSTPPRGPALARGTAGRHRVSGRGTNRRRVPRPCPIPLPSHAPVLPDPAVRTGRSGPDAPDRPIATARHRIPRLGPVARSRRPLPIWPQCPNSPHGHFPGPGRSAATDL